VNHKDKKGEGIQYFFDNVDRQGFSIYFVHYNKYGDEGVVLYKTSNLLNGFM